VPLVDDRIDITVRGIRPIELAAESLKDVHFPALVRPRTAPNEAPTEELVKWGTKLYAYSAVAHIHKILVGLTCLAQAENVPAANIVSRHVFEWTAHGCYMHEKLKDCYERKDWEQAWTVLTPAAIGNIWARKHGAKYAPPSSQPLPTVPDPIRIRLAVSDYEEYQLRMHGWKEAKDTYGLLSELSHPNSACLQQYHAFGSDGSITIEYVEPPGGANSPLPFVNCCLIDFLLFVDALLQLATDTEVRAAIHQVLGKFTKLVPKTRA
jgi:hypothetical protein